MVVVPGWEAGPSRTAVQSLLPSTSLPPPEGVTQSALGLFGGREYGLVLLGTLPSLGWSPLPLAEQSLLAVGFSSLGPACSPVTLSRIWSAAFLVCSDPRDEYRTATASHVADPRAERWDLSEFSSSSLSSSLPARRGLRLPRVRRVPVFRAPGVVALPSVQRLW